MTVQDLPAINATLNTISALCVMTGWLFIRAERKRAHIIAMTLALTASALFLASYLYYHFNVPGVTKFTGQGFIRPVYFSILISHTILATAVLPLVVMTVVPALRARYDRHRRLARWTLPVWLYVSVTGVVIYMMLYQWFPPVVSAAAQL